MSNRTYQSGAAKRKKISEAKEHWSKSLTLTSFLLVQKSKTIMPEDLFLYSSTSFIALKITMKVSRCQMKFTPVDKKIMVSLHRSIGTAADATPIGRFLQFVPI